MDKFFCLYLMSYPRPSSWSRAFFLIPWRYGSDPTFYFAKVWRRAQMPITVPMALCWQKLFGRPSTNTSYLGIPKTFHRISWRSDLLRRHLHRT